MTMNEWYDIYNNKKKKIKSLDGIPFNQFKPPIPKFDPLPNIKPMIPNILNDTHGIHGRKGLLHTHSDLIETPRPGFISDPFARRVELRPRHYSGGFDVLDPTGHTFKIGIARKRDLLHPHQM